MSEPKKRGGSRPGSGRRPKDPAGVTRSEKLIDRLTPDELQLLTETLERYREQKQESKETHG